MSVEYSPSRRARMRKRAKALRGAQTWGGPITIRHINDPEGTVRRTLPPTDPKTRRRAEKLAKL